MYIFIEIAGIRYITEDLLRRICTREKCEKVEDIKSINLILSKENGKKIKVSIYVR